MLKRIYTKIKTDGLTSLLDHVYRCVVPYKLDKYKRYYEYFDSKKGLEIGGPSGCFTPKGLFPVYSMASQIDNCNFSHQTIWEREIREENGFSFNPTKPPGTQYIAEAADLTFIGDETYDFVISSHCIEHLANPLRGLSEWTRVLKTNGMILLIVPHKNGTCDRFRPITTLQHLIQDYQQAVTESDLTHLEEVLSLHDFTKESFSRSSYREMVLNNYSTRSIHHHVFDTYTAIEMMDYMQLRIHRVVPFRPFHIAIFAQKADTFPVDNRMIFEAFFAGTLKSPFPADKMRQKQKSPKSKSAEE
ncbi:MAG: class I SAM-dependent methyltransferase [Kiritimatiellaeota bacterium]|nr:class I SAM-dependent methyltransferase [Kiritimatiellota bacterium]